MEQENNARSVTIADLWDILVHRLWIIALVSFLMTGVVFVYQTLTFQPRYTSTATLYILRQGEDESKSQAKEDFTLALNVVNDCTYILKSHAVLDEVTDLLSLDISYDALSKSLTTRNPDDTRILEVSIESESPEEAKRIVDSVCEIGSRKIQEAMGFNQVNLYEKGIIRSEPSNRTGLLTYAVIAIAIATVVYVFFLVKTLLDDRIRSEADIAKYLHLSVLGDIPNANEPANKHGDGYYYYGAKSNRAEMRERRKEEQKHGKHQD